MSESKTDQLVGRWTWHDLVSSPKGPEKPVTRHVLLALGRYMSTKTATAFPSTRTLAADTGLARQTVMRHMELAESGGWIARSEVKGVKGQFGHHLYTVAVPAGLVTQDDQASPAPGHSDATARSSSDAGLVTQDDQNHTSNQEEEQERDTFHPAYVIRDLLSLFSLDGWEKDFVRNLQRQLEGGRGISDAQLDKLKDIHDSAKDRKRAETLVNVPTTDHQEARWRGELEHVLEVKRCRLAEGNIAGATALDPQIDRLETIVSRYDARPA